MSTCPTPRQAAPGLLRNATNLFSSPVRWVTGHLALRLYDDPFGKCGYCLLGAIFHAAGASDEYLLANEHTSYIQIATEFDDSIPAVVACAQAIDNVNSETYGENTRDESLYHNALAFQNPELRTASTQSAFDACLSVCYSYNDDDAGDMETLLDVMHDAILLSKELKTVV